MPVVDVIHPESNKCTTGVEIKDAGDSKLNEGSGHCYDRLDVR